MTYLVLERQALHKRGVREVAIDLQRTHNPAPGSLLEKYIHDSADRIFVGSWNRALQMQRDFPKASFPVELRDPRINQLKVPRDRAKMREIVSKVQTEQEARSTKMYAEMKASHRESLLLCFTHVGVTKLTAGAIVDFILTHSL